MLTAAERETIIRIGYADDGREVVSVYSTQRAVWRKAERAGWAETMRDGAGREYEAPAAQLRYSLRTGESVASERVRRAEVLRGRLVAKTPVTLGVSHAGGASGGGRD